MSPGTCRCGRVEFHILLSLAAGERHGYGIILDIQERGDAPVPDVGTMYRALARMVETRADRSRRAPAGAGCGRRAAQLLPDHGAGPPGRDRGGPPARIAHAGRAHRRTAAKGGEMNSHGDRLVDISERWFRLLQRLYPPDFRDDMGDAVVEAYRDRARAALIARRTRHAAPASAASAPRRVWIRALRRLAAQRPRRTRAARGVVAARRQLGPRCGVASAGCGARRCSSLLTVGTLDARARHVRASSTRSSQKMLIEPMPYRDPGDLYYVWRDYGPIREHASAACSPAPTSPNCASRTR